MAIPYEGAVVPRRHSTNLFRRAKYPPGLTVGHGLQPALYSVFVFKSMQQDFKLQRTHSAYDLTHPRSTLRIKNLDRTFFRKLE
jgi:hypothetical protein